MEIEEIWKKLKKKIKNPIKKFKKKIIPWKEGTVGVKKKKRELRKKLKKMKKGKINGKDTLEKKSI